MKFIKKYFFEFSLTLLVFLFLFLKLQTIATPYFWDELGVYVPGALMMKDNHTIGLLPSCLEPLFSRGHPLLFVFLQAAYFKFFGDSVVSGHSFSILLGCLTLIVFYWCSKDLFNKKTALIASVLLAAQPVFFAMSGVVLPEMMLTLFSIPAIWAIIKNKWWLYVLFASLAMLTKEAAIVIPGLALVILFINSFQEKDFFSINRFYLFFLAAFPIILFAVFLLIQKKQNGWYFFPLHLGYIDPSEMGDKAIKIFKDIFIEQGRFFTSIFLLLGLCIFYKKLFTLHFHSKYFVVLVFLILGIISASLNFYMERYILFVIPFIILISTHLGLLLLDKIKGKSRYYFTMVVVMLGVFIAIIFLQRNKFNDTADMSYLQVVKCEKDAIIWLEQQSWKNSLIETNFPIAQGISDKRYGYLSDEPIPHTVNFEKKTKYGVLFHLNDENIPVWNGSKFKVIKSFNQSFAHIDVVEFE